MNYRNSGFWPIEFLVEKGLLRVLQARERINRVSVQSTSFNRDDLQELLAFVELLTLLTSQLETGVDHCEPLAGEFERLEVDDMQREGS